MFDEIPAIYCIYTVFVWLWPTLHMCKEVKGVSYARRKRFFTVSYMRSISECACLVRRIGMRSYTLDINVQHATLTTPHLSPCVAQPAWQQLARLLQALLPYNGRTTLNTKIQHTHTHTHTHTNTHTHTRTRTSAPASHRTASMAAACVPPSRPASTPSGKGSHM